MCFCLYVSPVTLFSGGLKKRGLAILGRHMHSLTVKTKMRMFGLNQKGLEQKGAGGRKKGTKHI